MIAKAVANMAGFAFLPADISELVHSGVGESEHALTALFRQAAAAAPCVLFLDELQAVFAGSDDDESSSSGRMLMRQLALEMDRLHYDYPDVFVLGATNALEMLDAALLRPGRFDHVVAAPP
eukprot:CAMPEP_0113697430 /NCGR_PEP_ID=MMETSP0038_2-20120614/22131_1 /TAXON_ID=2898 /ORGANISM="Cryptomonas paramecium" /LENGTH=121 /DNA_ID=CAMNT_0000620443 /DNA_START=582 /DNA_END=944 /DNA_ORIENTATION=- /assembly_acc=CAM_ASM_000170